MTSRIGRPSGAMAVAFLALMVALSSTSYAAVKLRASSVTTREIKNRTIAAADLSAATQDALGGTLAFAGVAADGTLNGPNRDFGAARIVQSRPGVYCMSGLAAAPDHVQATIDAAGGDFGSTVQAAVGGFDACPAGTQVEVQTLNRAGDNAPQPFFVLVF